ncbi:MAG TPA: Ig-like domain-containing protein [Flavitalea sp.]|nr:Ig-like domain-containing protein [Flavitalea sp.]
MRVSLITHLFICTGLFTAFNASAGITENFNSKKGIPIHDIRMNLQNSCWTFHHFDVNNNGWNPKIEGDGAMVSDINALQYGNAGIYTPLLNVGSDIEVSFEYAFNENFSQTTTRWVKICLANTSNEILKDLATIDFNGVNAVKKNKYSTLFNNVHPGEYRLVLKFGGKGGTSTIAIDELKTSSPFKYSGGCNAAPVAFRDNITGMANRFASASLIENDKGKNNQTVSAYLIKGSPDGKVGLNEDGTFTFTPGKNFKGNITSFIYKICDQYDLCSADATAYIHFPPMNLVEFRGSYKNEGNVELVWNADAGNGIDKFELERSIDGQAWQNSGTIYAKNVLENREYTYIDNPGKNTALKKDLYYRLKQVKNDGSVATSRLLIVRVYNTRTVSMISVTPNPSKSDISVNVQLHENSLVSMRMIDASGGIVLHKTAEAVKGMNNILIDGSAGIKPGLYTLEVIVNSKERMLVKLIKE